MSSNMAYMKRSKSLNPRRVEGLFFGKGTLLQLYSLS